MATRKMRIPGSFIISCSKLGVNSCTPSVIPQPCDTAKCFSTEATAIVW